MAISRNEYEKRPLSVQDPNKFMKVLIACGATIEDLTARDWVIKEPKLHQYICMGYHPTQMTKTLKGTSIIIH